MRWNAWCCYALEDGERKSRFLVLYVVEEGSEMECLVLLCAESQREAWRQRNCLPEMEWLVGRGRPSVVYYYMS